MPLDARDARPARAPARSAFAGIRTGSPIAGGTATARSSSTGRCARLLHEADHVFYQSAFCRLERRPLPTASGTGRPRSCTTRSTPSGSFRASEVVAEELVLLLGGNQYQRYRVEAALETLGLLRGDGVPARLLIVAGG